MDGQRSIAAGLPPESLGWSTLLLVAAGLTGLNVLKPATVDDVAYLEQAARWAAHPGDPFGGMAIHYQQQVPAARFAAPPVAVAWLALGTAVIGPAVWGLKLWLFPWALLLCASLASLLRRAAPGGALPVLLFIAGSPFVLPSFNLMLDVPELALVLAALAVFGRAVETRRSALSVAAGALAGLAMQTRYDAAPVVVGLLAWSIAAGAPRVGVIAAGASAAAFVAVETSCAVAAGVSPLAEYVAGRAARDPAGHDVLRTARKLVRIAGEAGAALLPLALAALGAGRRITIAAALLVAGSFALFAFIPAGAAVLESEAFARACLGWMGPALIVAALLLFANAARPGRSRAAILVGLSAWCVAEAALAPFVSSSASVRRVIGALVALTLVAAGVLARSPEAGPRRPAFALAAVLSCALGLVFWAADLDSAASERRALDLARSRAAVGGAGLACVADHWGAFQQAAREAGIVRVTGAGPALARGTLLLEPIGIEWRGAGLDRERAVLVDSVPLPQRFPLSTRRSFYDGRDALRRADPRWIGARIYRVTETGLVLRARTGGPSR